jgi:cellulose biosynthesis protein BcsQ
VKVTVITGSDERLARTVVVINGKGGVGKTSISANIGGVLAANGYRVLVCDLDVSGNLKLDLGYVGDSRDDDGKGLVEAVWNDKPLHMISDVREGLDVIPGGRQLEMLVALSFTPMAAELAGGGVPQAFAAKLAEAAADYDVVLLDGAPGNAVLQDMALMASRYVVIPTRTDSAGWDGLRMVGPRVAKTRQHNTLLTYLGVVLFSHQSNATRILRSTKARLEEVTDMVPLFEAKIRHSETAAHDCRMRGQLAHELARDAGQTSRDRLAALRTRRDGAASVLPAQLSGSADSLAGDYQNLAKEILLRIVSHEEATPISNAAGGPR